MQRRTFLGSLSAFGLAGAAPAAAAAASDKTRFYLFQHFRMKNGSQPSRLHEFFSKSLSAVLNGIHSGPRMYFDAMLAADLPHVTVIYGFSSLEDLWGVYSKLGQNETLLKGLEALESGPEPAYESVDSWLLEAADYSPEIKAESADSPRIFELRVYHSPTHRQLAALHERFRGPEIKIFHRTGIHPILYGSTFVGSGGPNLVYLTPFADLAAREKAWAAFGADPDWQKVRKDSIAKSGEIVSNIQVEFYRATAYSPVR